MWYVVTETWHVLNMYKTERGAKLGVKKYAKRYQHLRVMEDTEFRRLEPMVETVNLMSGKKFMIRASEKGGCTDPGTETYWSM